MNTLPVWAMKFGLSVDRLRELIRADEKLRSLGKHLGGIRLYTEREAEKIRDAFATKQAAREAKNARKAVPAHV